MESNDGKDYAHPKEYIIGLPKETREKEFPDGMFILNKKNQVCIMKNGRPQFTKETSDNNKSLCSGKANILLCPETNCVWHTKSNQCRNKKNASKKVLEEDKIQREYYSKLHNNELTTGNIKNGLSIFNTKKQKSKVIRTLNLLIQEYNKEDDVTYLRHVIKKLNKLLVKIEDKDIDFNTHGFSISDYDNN